MQGYNPEVSRLLLEALVGGINTNNKKIVDHYYEAMKREGDMWKPFELSKSQKDWIFPGKFDMYEIDGGVAQIIINDNGQITYVSNSLNNRVDSFVIEEISEGGIYDYYKIYEMINGVKKGIFIGTGNIDGVYWYANEDNNLKILISAE